MRKKYVIILGGGLGKRFGGNLPKQFIAQNGKPILWQTAQKFTEYDKNIEVLLVLPKDFLTTWKTLTSAFTPLYNLKIIVGGNTRFESVFNALESIQEEEGIVLIHDGVRPFVPIDLIEKCTNSLDIYPAVVPTCSAIESVRIINADGSNSPIDRNKIQMVQTPQGFHLDKIKKAYIWGMSVNFTTFTDDAMVYEAFFKTPVQLIEGTPENIKITYKKDLQN